MNIQKRLNKAQAIRLHCLECAGGNTTEVSLCHIVSCALWPYRTGNHVSTDTYKKRFATALAKHPNEVAEILRLAENDPDFAAVYAIFSDGSEKVGIPPRIYHRGRQKTQNLLENEPISATA